MVLIIFSIYVALFEVIHINGQNWDPNTATGSPPTTEEHKERTTTPTTTAATTTAFTTTTEKPVVYDINAGPISFNSTPAKQGRDYMTIRDKIIMCKMIEELYKDAHLKIQTILTIRDAHEPAMAFQIGHMIGLIREKYKRMMETYREMLNKEPTRGFPPRTAIWPPYQDKPRTLFYMVIYEIIHELEWEIEKLIEMLENIPRRDVQMEPCTMKQRSTMKTRTRRYYTSPASGESSTAMNNSNRRHSYGEEERYKSRMREKFLLRRLGLNESLHTTKKRFFRGWPVEETWDHLQY